MAKVGKGANFETEVVVAGTGVEDKNSALSNDSADDSASAYVRTVAVISDDVILLAVDGSCVAMIVDSVASANSVPFKVVVTAVPVTETITVCAVGLAFSSLRANVVEKGLSSAIKL